MSRCVGSDCGRNGQSLSCVEVEAAAVASSGTNRVNCLNYNCKKWSQLEFIKII